MPVDLFFPTIRCPRKENAGFRTAALFFLGLLCAPANVVTADPGKSDGEANVMPGWEHANATLLNPLPLLHCNSEEPPEAATTAYPCKTGETLPPWLRVRVVAENSLNNVEKRHYYRIQFIESGILRTAWLAGMPDSDILFDPDRERLLRIIDPRIYYDDILPGRWELEHWDLNDRHPHTTGYLEIQPREEAEYYTGAFHTTADHGRDHDGRRRRIYVHSFGRTVVEQPIIAKVHGSFLIVLSQMKRRVGWCPTYMALQYKTGRLEGYAGCPRSGGVRWSALPAITFDKKDESIAATTLTINPQFSPDR